MIRINRETDYGVLILSSMAMEPERRYNAATLASQRGLPLPVVSKILKHLARRTPSPSPTWSRRWKGRFR
jgi:DNA-binding IscR family transcriptional regulator